MKKVYFLFSAISLVVFACKPNGDSEVKAKNLTTEQIETDMKKPESKSTTLGEKLLAKKQAFLEKADSHKIHDYEKGIEDVAQSGVLQSAKQLGEMAPSFVLTNANGDSISLNETLKKGPVVLTWYRGGWCPYCNITLRYLQEMLPEFKKEGATLMALTPELPDKSLDTKEKNALDFEVLSDLNNLVAKNYGVAYKLPATIADYYNKGFGLGDYNGNGKNELPLAATYVIDTQGIIQYAFLDADYRNRAEPNEVLNALQKLKDHKD